jgi:hypothetical protein
MAQLWGCRDDEVKLRNAWKLFRSSLDVVEGGQGEVGVARGDVAELSGFFPPNVVPTLVVQTDESEDQEPYPWRRERAEFDQWLLTTPYDELRDYALTIVKRELDAHLHKKVSWEYERNGDGDRFRLTVHPDSLWKSMWQAFGLDTYAGIGWRLCPGCGNGFYAKRSDQMFCSPLEQARASKREWARRNRAQLKAKGLSKKSRRASS